MTENKFSENMIFIINKGKIILTLGNRKNKCDVCGKYFKEQGNLNTHKKIHSGDRPHKCRFENCGKTFITLGNLRAHEDHHFGKKPFACTFQNCGFRYTRYSRLLIHLRTHTGDKPYKCPFGECDKSFNEKGNLKTHCRIHTGERPFACKFNGCIRAFKAHGHLKDHEKMHTKSRPYGCKICGKSYGRSGILKNHLKAHCKKKDILCNICGISFTEQNIFEEHSKTHKSYVENAKSLLDGSLPTQINEIKEPDDNVTISCTSNERTPMNFFKLMEVDMKIVENSPKTQMPIEKNPSVNNSQLNLLKIPKHIGQVPSNNSNVLSPSNGEFNNCNGIEETTKTPLSNMESKINQFINNGQDTMNYDEAIKLYEFYNNCLNNYLNIYNNDMKYTNFFLGFTEYMMNKENNNISLQKILNLLHLNRMYFNDINTNFSVRNVNNINLLNYLIGSPQVINSNNQELNAVNNFRAIIDNSPRFPITGNCFNSTSPIWHNNFNKNISNQGNTTTNITTRNIFSAPRNIQNNPTFSDYMNLYK